ncbi:hypothetical protein R3P38DRAFT_2798483 [Favolaschia claudopus]|uniref:Uncharacterized protein n=1 Tax=Favolaschia claudopus TaxID=2862362 RepID=A0AAW0A1I0_9AGAR
MLSKNKRGARHSTINEPQTVPPECPSRLTAIGRLLQKIVAGKYQLEHKPYPSFLYEDGKFDPNNLDAGLLHSDAVLRFLRHIWLGPSAALSSAEKISKTCNTSLHNVKKQSQMFQNVDFDLDAEQDKDSDDEDDVLAQLSLKYVIIRPSTDNSDHHQLKTVFSWPELAHWPSWYHWRQNVASSASTAISCQDLGNLDGFQISSSRASEYCPGVLCRIDSLPLRYDFDNGNLS